MTDFVIDDDTDDDPGAYLRISRDATADDLADILPGKDAGERAEWLRHWRDDEGASVTLAVVIEVPETTEIKAFGEEVPVREIAGLIIGPPGSERYLRRPTDVRVAPGMSALTDAEFAAGEALVKVAEHGEAEEASDLVGARELAAATLIVKHGTLDHEALALAGADETEVGAARALLSGTRIDAGRVYEIAARHVPKQIYGPLPEKIVFGMAVGQLDKRRAGR